MKTTPPELTPSEQRVHHRRRIINSFKAKADAHRTPAEKLADFLTDHLGSVTFLGLNIVWFAIWITINLGLWPGVTPFDPFPFGLLTMVVSLEAIALAIIVLISQNRQARVDELREEVDLQIDMIAEEEVTKIIKLLVLLLEKNDIVLKDDAELIEMLRPLHSNEIEHRLEKQLHDNFHEPDQKTN